MDVVEPVVGPGPRPVASLAGMRGKTKIPKASRPKRTVELDFQPNKFAPIVDLATFRLPDATHSFDHVPDGFELLGRDAASLLKNVVDQRFPNQYDQPQVDDANKRMANYVLAKKLTFAAPIDLQNRYVEEWKQAKNTTIRVPSFAATFGEGYGRFEHDGAVYTPRDMAINQFAHFARAVFNPDLDGEIREGELPVNVASPYWREDLRSYLCNRVERWIEKQPPINITLNGVGYAAPIPTPRTTNPLPATAANDIRGAGAQVPDHIESDLQAINVIDGLAINPGVLPPNLNPFRQANVGLVNWNRFDMRDRHDYYERNVQSKFSSVWATVYSMYELRNMEENGKAWQLADVSKELMTRSFFSLSQTDLAISHALDVAERRVKIETAQRCSTASTKTPMNMRLEVLRKGMITSEFK